MYRYRSVACSKLVEQGKTKERKEEMDVKIGVLYSYTVNEIAFVQEMSDHILLTPFLS